MKVKALTDRAAAATRQLDGGDAGAWPGERAVETSEGPPSGRAAASLRWYARPEVAGPWHLALCEEHAAQLDRYRFRRIDPPAGRDARSCAVCERAELVRVVENCTCKTDTGRCPEHRNLGCSC